MVKKKLSYRNKRKSIIRKNTKRLKGRKALFRNKTKKLKKRKSQKRKINFQRGGGIIKLNDYIKPASRENLNKSIDSFIEDFLKQNEGKFATLMKPDDNVEHHSSHGIFIAHPTRDHVGRTIDNTSETDLTGSPLVNIKINRVNLKSFIYSMKDKNPTPSTGNYFNGAYIKDEGRPGTTPLIASIQKGT